MSQDIVGKDREWAIEMYRHTRDVCPYLHARADETLCRLLESEGFIETVAIYRSIQKGYEFRGPKPEYSPPPWPHWIPKQ